MTKQETCEQRIDENLRRVVEHLRHYLGQFDEDDITVTITRENNEWSGYVELEDIDVRVDLDYLDEYFDCDDDEWDGEWDGDIDIPSIWMDYEDQLREQAYDRFHEWGLSFDFDDERGCYTYLLSWGGPSDGIRFYTNRIEYFFHDWFDGAVRTVTGEGIMRDLEDWFKDVGSIDDDKFAEWQAEQELEDWNDDEDYE